MTQESLEDGRRRMDGAVNAYDKDMAGVRTAAPAPASSITSGSITTVPRCR